MGRNWKVKDALADREVRRAIARAQRVLVENRIAANKKLMDTYGRPIPVRKKKKHGA